MTISLIVTQKTIDRVKTGDEADQVHQIYTEFPINSNTDYTGAKQTALIRRRADFQ